MPRLNQIIIKGYKSIKSLDLELKQLNVLIGSNGAGKSNFISFFKFMKEILDKNLPVYTAEQGGANKLLHFGKKTTEEIIIGLNFKPNRYVAVLKPNVEDLFIFVEEEGHFYKTNGGIFETELDSVGKKNSALPASKESSVGGYVVEYIYDWKVYHFHDTSSSAQIKNTANINDYSELAVHGGNIAPFLYAIKKNNEKSYNKIIKTIQRVAPFFQNFILEPEINNKETIKLKWKHKGSDEYFDANDFSDGTLRFVCLTTLLLQPNLPTMIILDEPELGLHPYALNILASMFRVVSNSTQIICSTQSVTFADNFDIEDIVVVDRVNNCSEFKRLKEDDYKSWLDDYSLGEIWQKNIIGGVPNYD